jgi:hypothetical protein
MSKYDPLYVWLRHIRENRIECSFSKIESILGFDLPPSARLHRAWWANEKGETPHSHCQSWINAGFEATEVSLFGQTVTFRRVSPSKVSVQNGR